MTAFPPEDWDVRPLEDMDSFEMAPRRDHLFSMQPLLALSCSRARST